MKFATALLILTAACTVSPSASITTPTSASSQFSSPTPSPKAPEAYAAMVKDFFFQGGSTYTVSLVATDGHVVAEATAPKRNVRNQIGSLSTSKTTLYYLDGDADIRFLRPDGSTGIATHVALGPKQVAAFAVSPDDRRIAVSVLDFTRYPAGTRLYVEDLTGGANHIELFSSPTILEWPAGWHNGALVIAIGKNARPQDGGEWFEHGSGYLVADAQTGDQIQSLCSGADSYIPESPAGTVCTQYPNASAVVSWDGASRQLPKDGLCNKSGPLSPSGVVASRDITLPDGGCTAGPSIFLIAADGTEDHSRALVPNSQPEGWMDNSHLVVVAETPRYAPPDFVPARSVVDIRTGVDVTIQPPGVGFFAAALPGGL